MRKLFTRLISIFILSSVIVLQGFAQTFPVLGPTDNFANIKKTDTFVLTASEAVEAGAGVIRLLSEGGATLAAYQATNSNVSITDEEGDDIYEITVDFTSLLAEGTNYTLQVDANFVKAVDGATPNSSKSWTVTVGDYTAPVLADTDPLDPANGETVGVQLDAILTATFDEDIQVVPGGIVSIYTDNGTTHGDLYDYVVAEEEKGAAIASGGLYATDNVLTIVPNKEFKGSTKYYVVIPTGVVVDASGNDNAFAGWTDNASWVFTTRDATAPEITSIMADNIGNTSFDVVLQLDKPGKVYVLAVAKDATAPSAATVISTGESAEVAAAATNVTVELDGFVEGDSYDVYVVTENAEETDPTQSDASKELTVTTADVTAPTVELLYPADGEPESDVNEMDGLIIDATEDIVLGTGSIDIYTWDAGLNHELLVSVPVASCTVIGGDSLEIPVDKSLWDSEATYFVEYSEGIVTDAAGNKLAGVDNTEAWKFTVQDFLAPTYTIVPTDGTRDADEAAPQVTITFNEDVYDDEVVAYTETTIMDAIDIMKDGSAVSYSVTSFDGQVLKINLGTVASKDTFFVTIDNKLIYDQSGNGGTDEDIIEFSIRDFQGPEVDIEPDYPGETDNILITFDEPVFNADGSAITDADVANMVIFRKGDSSSGSIVSATYSVAADAMSFIIDPTNDFANPGDEYYVSLGAGAVVDASGNANVFTYKILEVDDFVAPTAEFSGIGDSPVNPSVVAPVITFSEAMATLDGTAVIVGQNATSLINLKEDGENIEFTAAWTSTTTIEILAVYDYNKTYTISVGKSLEDLNENAFEGVSTTFTTWSNAAPEMVSVTPEDEAVEQENDVAVEVTFDQDIELNGSGTITLAGTSATVGTVDVDGAVLTIGHTDFSANEAVTVTVPAGYVKGTNGIVTTSEVSWMFYTKDTDDPYVTVYSPLQGASGVAIDSKLKLTFSEDIVLGTGQILIKDAASDVTVQSLTEANAEVVDDNALEITPTADFVYGKEYYVVITDGVVADAAGNTYAGITNPATWSFTVAETPGAFVVESTVPADEEDKVDEAITTITVDFNRDIKAGTLSSIANVMLTGAGTGLVFDDAANTGRFSISGNTLTIQTLGDLVADETYTLEIDAGIVTDEWDTDNDAASITFYTFDNNGPQVVSTTPAEDAYNVSVNTTIVITWDETPLYGGASISAANIKDSHLVLVDGSDAYTASVNGLVWTLTLDAALSEKTDYTVDVYQNLVADALGNSQGEKYTWSFTTEDVTAPTVSGFLLTDNTAGTEVTFTVDLDEAGTVYYMVADADATAPTAAEIMAANSIVFESDDTSEDQMVTGLVSGADYTAYFVAVDTSSNQSTILDEDFTTADVVSPTITAMVPANGATGVDADTKLWLTFDEVPELTLAGGHVIIRELDTDIIVDEFDVTTTSGNATVDSDAKTVEITKTATLGSQTTYYVEVSAGTFQDAAGNTVAGISGSDAWAFTTKDTDAPMLESTSPDYDASTTPEIAAGTALSIEFNEAMQIGAGVVYVRYYTGGTVFDVINASALVLSEDKKTITFSLNNVPEEQAEFYVDLSGIALADTSDNAWVETILGSKEWNFIILDQTPPALDSSTPEDGATGVDIATPIVLTFTEEIYQSPDGEDFDGTAAYIGDEILVKDASGATLALDTVVISPDKKVVTITPEEDLTSETTYTIYVSPVVDDHLNVSSEITVTFTTKDMTAPYVTMWDPDYLTMFNPKTGVVTVTFSEPIYDDVVTTSEGNTVVVDIMDENIPDFFTYSIVADTTQNADGTLATYTKGTAVEFTGTISEDKTVITLTPVADEVPLASDEGYVVELLAGKVEDDAENPNTLEFTIFGIEDYEAPEVAEDVDGPLYTPKDATLADAAMTITFTEDVAVGSGNIYIRNYENGEVVETIAIDATTASVEDNVATIVHADFPEAMSFYVTADAGVFTDATANANPWAGIASSDIEEWRFSTADAVAPGVLADGGLYPEPGATNVTLNTPIEITFDKKIAVNDDGTKWVIIYNDDWTPFQVIEVNTLNITLGAVTDPVYETDRVFSISHENLEENSTYYVRVMEGSVVDEAGNTFAGILDDSWSFTTEDNQAPVIVNLTPEDDATGVSGMTDLTIEFDRGVMGNSAGMIMLYKEQEGELGTLIETIDPTSDAVTIESNIATISLSQTLEYNTNYYVIVEAASFTNLASSKLPLEDGITTTQGWNFSTGDDMDDPVLETMSPDDETIADNHPTFVMTFSEDVVLGDLGYLYVTEKDSTEAKLMIEITSDMIDGNTVTVDYVYDETVGGLKINTEYNVTLDSAIVKDATGNAYAGLTDNTVWTFTTGSDYATVIDEPVVETVGFKVYPNPFNESIMIDNNDQLTRVVVHSITGQKVIDIKYPEHEISTSRLVSGVYLISLINEEGIAKTERMVKR